MSTLIPISESPAASPPWLHRWAVLTVCATLPLLLLGAEVTTKQVGMVDPVGFREPWHLFRVLERAFREVGFFMEHSHRLVGFVVGTCVIVLAVSLWLREPRRWVRWLGVAALAGVTLQGLLGGFRVQLDARMGKNLALVHGCFAQLVFALLVSVALITSRSWLTSAATTDLSQVMVPLRRWSLLTAGLVYLQIVFGAVVRHKDAVLGARAHLLLAFGVVAAVVWLLRLVIDLRPREKPLFHTALFLAGLVLVQLFLGVESWMSKFGSSPWWQLQPVRIQPELLRSLHYLGGSAIFATAVAVTLQAHRRPAWAGARAPAPLAHLEGAA